jgi:hypothetical protein
MLSQRLLLTCAVALAVAVPSTSLAKSIDLDTMSAGDVLVVNAHHELTYDDLLVLAARDDNGWHLGWFKHKEGASSTQSGAGLPSAIELVTAPAVVSLPVVIASGQTPAATTSSSAATAQAASSSTTASGPSTTASQGSSASTVAENSGGSSSPVQIEQIPEPAMLLLFGAGLAAAVRRSRRGTAR